MKRCKITISSGFFKNPLCRKDIEMMVCNINVPPKQHSLSNQRFKMSEKLCLQWNSFNENVNPAFGRLRSDKEFTDVTLACEGGQQMEAHKVILASSSPFFEKILKKSKHPHPLIYLKGFRAKDFVSILDFLYFGEANVFQNDLDSVLAIAEEIELKGLTGQTSSDILEEEEKPKKSDLVFAESQELLSDSTNCRKDLIASAESRTFSKPIAIPNQSSTDLQVLDEKVKTIMKKGEKMIPHGKQANGTPKQATSFICRVNGKDACIQ